MQSLKFLLILCCLTQIKCAKILGIFPNPSRSHYMLGRTYLEALARQGHDVTMVNPYPDKSSVDNFKLIEIDGLQRSKDDSVSHMRTLINGTMFEKVSSLRKTFEKLNVMLLTHPKFKQILASDTKYDVVVLDWVFTDVLLGVAHHFNAHSIVFSSISSSTLVNRITANPAPTSYVPNIIPAVSDEMTFLQRVGNTLGKTIIELQDVYQQTRQNQLLHQHFPNAPHITDLLHNVSMVFINSHYTIESPKPYVPTMIPIGGFHIKKPKALPADLQKFLDEAKDGVLYCSFGSIIKSSDFPLEKIQGILNAFRKLPLRVLWKFESDKPLDLPPNVKVSKWFPQNDILAHPNIKLFVGHGGLLSVMESIYHGIPFIGIPFFGDHESNVEYASKNGYCIRIPFHDLNEETLGKAIKRILDNPKYRQNIKERSLLFRDRPMHPLDNAVYWLEFVLRNNGAHHLKTGALKLTWYQHYLLDVAVLLLLILTILFITSAYLFRGVKKMFAKKPVEVPKKFL